MVLGDFKDLSNLRKSFLHHSLIFYPFYLSFIAIVFKLLIFIIL